MSTPQHPDELAEIYALLLELLDERQPEPRCAELRARIEQYPELYHQLCCEEQIRELLHRCCCQPAPVTLRQKITMSIRVTREY
ncbi:hypothetical protein [Corynebacterium spheniscorum]|uniref:Anti-sigma factor, TIGR02949 family n=1 Tax=Corynebacterium spheniscorum TaxID=185761 RepID=A0A1I2PY33_9CORY|nr:hypothetical protein [Corynebacterium spheniscorum]KAA8723476.1 mycothiol system anti-sigma-R factor [Corynebacterium spheniscorum]SFG20303.1 anti-sigma factor, TIGR02949 family [Corynebacterium spheniscorum]